MSSSNLENNARRALNNLQRALQGQNEEVNSQVFLFADVGARSGSKYRYVDMTLDLATEFKECLTQSLIDILDEILRGGGGLLPFSFESLEDGHLFYLPIDDGEIIQTWMERIPMDESGQAFNGDDNSYAKKLKYYFISLAPLGNGLRLLAFRQKGASQTIKKGKLLAISRHLSGNYERLEDNVLEFDKLVDFFIWEGFIFVKSPQGFENITKYRRVATQLAEECMVSVLPFLPQNIQNNVQDRLLSNYLFTKKIANIQRANSLDNLTPPRLCEQIQRHGLNHVFTIDGNGDNQTISFDYTNTSHMWEFLHLIADSHYISPMTERQYTALSKKVRN